MKSDLLMPGVKRITFNNGLMVLLARGPKPKKNVIMVGFKAGSAYENDGNVGLFHFLEHILFKSTKIKKSKKILEELEDEGTQVNAGTDYHYTALYAKMLPHLTVKTLRSFFEMVANPEYDKRELDLEKKVVLDEMENDKDNPVMHSNEFFFSSLFPGQYLSRPLSGYFHTIKDITKEDLEETKKKYYIPNNAAIIVIGKFNEEEILRAIQDTFGKLEPGVSPPPLPKIETVNCQTIKMVSRDALSPQVYLCLGYKVPNSNHKDYPKLVLLDSVLSGGLSSRLFIALRERRGIGYEVGTQLSDFVDIGVFYALIPGFYKKRLQVAIKVILAEFQKLKKTPVSCQEFDRAKSRFSSKYEESLEDPVMWANQILMKEFFGGPYDFRKFSKYIKRLTPRDIKAAAQEYFTENYTLTALLPKGFTPFK